MLIGSVIVAQMLPDKAVVKGGISVKFRLGEVGTRATADLDVAARNRTTFLDELNQRLEIGWGTVPASRGALKRNPDAPPRRAFSGMARPARRLLNNERGRGGKNADKAVSSAVGQT
ncbi:hypothetical protein [Mycobacterium ostraviense]|nr:hypothetical protein [Mycobacterium ostraviense]